VTESEKGDRFARFVAACDSADRADGIVRPAWQERVPTRPGHYWRAFWVPTTRRGGAGHWSMSLHDVTGSVQVWPHILWWPVPVVPPAPPEGAPSL